MSVQVITDQNLQNVILVGHSLAGVWMQQMLQQMPKRIGMMVFVDAVVLETGESFFSNKIAGVLSPHSEYPAQVLSQRNRLTNECLPSLCRCSLQMQCHAAAKVNEIL